MEASCRRQLRVHISEPEKQRLLTVFSNPEMSLKEVGD